MMYATCRRMARVDVEVKMTLTAYDNNQVDSGADGRWNSAQRLLSDVPTTLRKSKRVMCEVDAKSLNSRKTLSLPFDLCQHICFPTITAAASHTAPVCRHKR
ncbi:hypothetical protein GCK32_015183 [Trichostrongylus colubriformis]|uniref:Uncharacterized protein n=1 Tax=Trichostrongylus colubriformis TaxID=6319 RepID=A0AAN8F4Y2_TRICO